MEKFFQTLAALLPTGFAWPRDAGSTLMRVIRALAASFSEHHDVTTEAVRQWQPATTVNRLAEWEEATGLPDPCFTPPLELLQPGRYPVDAGRIASSTRATPATYLDATGVLLTAAVNQARFDYSAGVAELLVEAEATNLLKFSQQLNLWAANGLTLAVDAMLAPDGTMTAETSASAVGTRYMSVASVTAGVALTYSLYVRPANPALAVRLFADGAAGVGRVDVVPGTGVVSSLVGTMQAVYVLSVGGGWYRLSGRLLPTATGLQACHIYPLNADLHGWWNAQLEVGSVATSAILTNAAAVTRAADQIYLFPTEAATRALRRQLLLGRLRGPVLAYDNASPASPAAIVAICAALGYVATVNYNTPFRCGVNRVGDRLGALDGKLYVTVTLQSKAFRVGVSRVGERLLEGQLNGGELACYLQRVLPARYQLNVIFV